GRPRSLLNRYLVFLVTKFRYRVEVAWEYYILSEYDRTDAGFYDRFSTGIDGDVAFYVEEARKAGGPVLEIGCGTGRIMIPIAESGVAVVGLDQAPAMLDIARAKVARLPDKTRQRVRLVDHDMRAFDLDRRFNLVVIPYRTFNYMLTEEDQRTALKRINDHLTDYGRLVFDVMAPSPDVIAASLDTPGGSLDHIWTFTHPDSGNRVMAWDTRQFDPVEQSVTVYQYFHELDHGGKEVSNTVIPIFYRYLYRYEMQHLLELCGFEVEALYGDFRRSPLHRGTEQVWMARKTGNA
ncbi:MAG: class I SAM-dependent methyltransferase, partial [Gemmatimonadetes bacterium]|nr:class I SAM-dependent methyltransferase [Gemmatimonadota bacterium]